MTILTELFVAVPDLRLSWKSTHVLAGQIVFVYSAHRKTADPAQLDLP